MSEQPPSWQAFLAELKRRRVFRVMAVYGAAAFVVLQVADLAFPRLGLPEWTITFALALALLGFPLAIVLAWAFETTPEGVRRTAPASPAEIEEIVAQPRRRRWTAGLLALAGMILLFATGWWMGAGRDHDGGGGPARIVVPEARAAEVRSLAVLPFENVNEDDDNRIMARGIHEDLLTQLTRIGALRVTSRTSVREYEDTSKSLRVIADELGVEYILEGAVRSSAEQLRVDVTLVDAVADERIWTDQYDREVTPENLFAIQSDIARRVVEALEAQLTPQEAAALDAIEPGSASELAAQTWFYRGLALMEGGGPGGMQNVEEARDALARAVEIDPEFTAAWTALTRIESFRVFNGLAGTEGPAAARRAMERTMELAPGTVEADLARGFHAYYAEGDYDAALDAFRAAEATAPSDADVLWALGLILRRQGQWAESTEMLKRAVRLDPRNYIRLETLFENLVYMGAFRDADAVIEHALSVNPENAKARGWKVWNLVEFEGSTAPAWRLAAEFGLDGREFPEAEILFGLALLDRDYPRMLEIANRIETHGIPLLEVLRLAFRGQALHLMGDTSVVAVADSLLARATTDVLHGPDYPVVRGFAHALAGRRAEAARDLRDAARQVRRWEDNVDDPRRAGGIAVAYGMIGELDTGFDLLDDIVARPGDFLSVGSMRLAGAYDPFRDDPRFAELIERRERFEADGAAWAAARRPWVP